MKSFSKRKPFLRFWSMFLVVGLGFLLTSVFTIFVRQLEQRTIEAYFVQLAEDEIFAIHTAFDWYLEPLEAFAAFYHASVAISRHEFATFVKPFLAQRPGIAAIQWIPYIPDDQRVVYETAMTKEAASPDVAHFTFTEYALTAAGEGHLVPVSTRTGYYPIYYQASTDQGSLPLGFDFGSDPTYLQALLAARDQGQGVAVERVALGPLNEPHPFVIQIFYPIYASADGALGTLEVRQRSLIGFIAIVLRVHNVLDNILRNMPPDDIDLWVYEHYPAPTQKLLYRNPAHSAATFITQPATFASRYLPYTANSLVVVKPLTALEEKWQLVLRPTATYLDKNSLWYDWIVWIGGMVGTVIIAGYLYTIISRNRVAEMMVRERTDELRQTNEQLQATLQELQFQKSLLESTSEAAQEGILVVSPERKWLFFNQRFVEMWQLPQEIAERRSSAEGMPWVVSQIANSGRSRENIEKLYADPWATSFEEVVLKNGAVYERFSAPVQRADGFVYARAWYFRDVSQRKKAEAALQASQQQLQERERHEKALIEAELARVRNQLVTNTRLATLGQVAATIAHELRNPLGAVRNAVYYIRRYLIKDQPQLFEFLQIIDMEVATADRIITDLLEMSRAKEPGIQQLDLSTVVREIWRQLKQPEAIQFHCHVAQVPFWVWADATQFRQILINLLTNAVQAMPQGGDLTISGVYQGDDAVITIQDSGPGVPPALREQIFEPLFTTKAKGTGLGLTLCRQIMEKHGGAITLLACEQGASFELRFPNRPKVEKA